MALTNLKKPSNGFLEQPGLLETLLGSELFDDMNLSIEGAPLPAMNVINSNDNLVIEMDAPGLNLQDFTIKVENNILAITSEIQGDIENKGPKENTALKDPNCASFQRSMHLPEDIETEGLIACYEEGVLSIAFPKKQNAKTNHSIMLAIS